MNNQEFAPFYVGQEVEAVINHSVGAFKKGQRFTVTAVTKECKCDWIVYIGMKDPDYFDGCIGVCAECRVETKWDGQWGFLHIAFRAITPAMEAVTFEKITEQHPVSVN